MVIPDSTIGKRYFVALSQVEAHSSWDSYNGALSSLKRLEASFSTENVPIIGIVRTDENGKCLLKRWRPDAQA